MLFSTKVFIFLFLPLVLLGYYFLKWNRTLQNIFLTFCSLFFYAYGEPYFVLIMIASVMANWGFGLLVDKFRESKWKSWAVIVAMLVFNLTILGIFKYLMFILGNVNFLFGSHIPIPKIVLPIGISFFTFQAISYVLDVYRGHGAAQKNPLNVGLYISFFPQLIAGPIVRYETIAEQIQNRKETIDDFSEGVCRFIVGLSKKMLIANSVAWTADSAFALSAGELSVAMAWLGALAYTLQIYYDFSGYSDMAIGLGKMFGFHFLENFNYPYTSLSVSDFWRRWHMSLSSWFRDYVYFPLGGSRVKSSARLAFNLFVVWSLTGLWHGANWTFICWGLFYFVLLVFEKFTHFEKRFTSPLLVPLRWGYTMLFVVIGWVLLRAESIGGALTYLHTMFGLSNAPLFDDRAFFHLHENFCFLIFGIIFSFPTAVWLQKKLDENKMVVGEIAYSVVYVFLFFISVCYVIKGSYNPFIYFNF